MKKMKKIVSLLLALVMVFCMTTTTFAAENTTGSITVENPVAGQNYTAYKIFDVVYSGDNYAYSISSSNEWYSTIKSYADVTSNGLVLNVTAADATIYIVETTNGFSAASFATVLKAAAGKSGTALKVETDSTTAIATDLELGYYFVTSTSGTLCNLTSTDPDAVIYDKNDISFTKTADDTSVEVGQTVTYTVTGKVPSTTGFSSYTYEVKDKMSEGLTFNKDVSVKVGDNELEQANYTVNYNSTENDFVLTINVMNLQTYVAEEIIVTYSATVNEAAVSAISENKATLTYSNDPTKDATTTTTPVIIPVYTAKIVIDKFAVDNTLDNNADNARLAGAKFVLYKKGEGNVNQYYQYDNTNKKVSWGNSIDDATVMTTDNEGAANFIGLENGTYYLRETEAPAGYNLLKEDKLVTIDGTSAAKADLTSLTVKAEVENNTGTELPSTGGVGTTMFYVIGGGLVLCALVLLIVRKRMNSEK